jgi:hypothetical protein
MNFGRIFIGIFLMMPSLVSAQRFGGNPPSLRWHQTGSDTLRVLFPPGYESQAKRVAELSHRVAQVDPAPLGRNIKGINILLQSRPLISNAYVGLAPWRSEFYLTPLQNSLQLGSVPWLDMLSLHEYRHVQQYANFNRGLSKIASWVAGEQGQALANSISVPDWFFEGDAVDQETMLSSQGRGRLPDFFNGYRSLWNEGRSYRYMKLRNGSLKHYVPDHYQLGYLLVAAGREKFGTDIWSKVTADAAAFRPLFYPFQGSFKRHTGRSFKSFSTEVLRNEIKLSTHPGDSLGGSIQWLTDTHNRSVKDHQFPIMIGGDSLLMIRRGYDHIPYWYLLHAGQQHRLAAKDIGIDDYFTYGNGLIAYTAYHPHPRWSWQEFNEIMILDIRSGKRQVLTHGGRYFSPGISKDGSRIAAVHVDGSGRSKLHVLDAADGKLLFDIPNHEGYFHTYPVFGQDRNELFAAVRDHQGKMALIGWDLKDLSSRIILPFVQRPIANPSVHGDHLTFTSSFEGFDRLFILDLNTSTLHLPPGIPPAIRGATFDPVSHSISFAAFTADGYRIGRQVLSEKGWLISESDWITAPLDPVFPVGKRTTNEILTDSTASHTRPVRSYSSLHRPLNIHSWRLGFDQPEWSFDLYGENVLNTIRTGAYYRYNVNEGFHKIGADALVSILYPWVRGGFSVTRDRYVQLNDPGSGTAQSLRWDEWTMYSGLSLPLNLTRGRHFKYLNLSAGYQHQGITYREASFVKPGDRRINYLNTSISWSMQTQMARQQIFPKWAHAISLSQRTGISGLAANQFLGSASIYLPGATPRQSLVLNGAWQQRDTMRQYIFSNAFPLSRGYPGVDYPHMWKTGVNYHFTMAYPDIGLLQMAYLLRIRGNLFYDHSWVKSLRQQRVWSLRSVGAELHLDTKWWNQLPVNFGVRYARLLDTEIYTNKPSLNRWELVIPVGLIPGGPGGLKHGGF